MEAKTPQVSVRRLAWFAGGFSGGVFLVRYCLPGGWPLGAGVLSFALALGALLLPWDGRCGAVRRRAVLLCAALAIGLGWSWLFARQVQRPAEALAGREGRFTAQVLDYPEVNAYSTRTLVRLEGVRAFLYGGPENLQPGQTVTGTLRLQSAARIRETSLSTFTSRGVFLLAYSRGGLEVSRGTAGSLRWLALRMGLAVQAQIRRFFEGDAAAVLAALFTGERSLLSDKASAGLTEAGLSHVLAVSGMHCGILLAFLTLFTGHGRLRVLAALPVLAFYTLLTGARPSVVRACLMLALLLLAPLFRRENDPPTALLTALMLILLQNPFAAASAGLQLSFAAVAGILWLTPKLNARLPRGVRKRQGAAKARALALRAVLLSLSVTAGALVFTVPLTALYFGTLSLVTPLSNLLCLPAVSALFCLGLAAVCAGLVCPPLGRLLAIPAQWLVRYILEVSGLLAGLPGHAAYFCNPYLKYWLCYAYLLFAAAYLLRRTPPRKYALAAVLAGLTLLLTVRLGAARFRSGLDVLLLDVGQGQSVVLASGGSFALVDCGSANQWVDPASVAGRQLRTMGCSALDCLILTHSDSDHVSGVPLLLDRMPVRRLLLPPEGDWTEVLEAAEQAGVPVEFLTERTEAALGRAALTVFPPVGEGEDNNRGLSVLASVGDKDFLLTGDMDGATERRLLEAWDLPDLEGFAAGHHGSKYSTSDALLEALRPETVCISTGSNAYGHPAEETLARLARYGCAVYRTDRQGTIHLSWNREESYGNEIQEEGAQ